MDDVEKVKIELIKDINVSLENYRKITSMMYGDAPIETLCLPKSTNKLLISQGFCRIYDLFNCDLTEIKGISNVGLRDLTTRVNEFLSMGG